VNIERIPLKYFVGLSVVVLIGILFFGLRPKDFNFTNGVSWIKDEPGIRFSKYGIAYTKPFIDSKGGNISDPDGFSIEIALKPANYGDGRFSFILAFHNGEDSKQLVMGQWRSSLIIMNGNDYAHKRGIKRIGVDMASQPRMKQLVTITTGDDGTNIFFDGKLVHSKNDLILKIPDGEKARLLLGNSAQGKHYWQGDIYGLAFYRYTLSAQDAARHFKEWATNKKFSFAGEDKPSVLYVFDEKEGEKAVDYAGGNHHLQVPLKMLVLEKEVLALPWEVFESHNLDLSDIIINLAGFIPFGLALAAMLVKFGGFVRKHGILITVVIGFIVSLFIEITQAWLPSRSSSLLDLLLNTLGTLIGAMIFLLLCKRAFADLKGEERIAF